MKRCSQGQSATVVIEGTCNIKGSSAHPATKRLYGEVPVFELDSHASPHQQLLVNNVLDIDPFSVFGLARLPMVVKSGDSHI